tara:strand:- start:82 stop:261 length:180 start_codon:yes stop_codon:yes gene_type:complete
MNSRRLSWANCRHAEKDESTDSLKEEKMPLVGSGSGSGGGGGGGLARLRLMVVGIVYES